MRPTAAASEVAVVKKQFRGQRKANQIVVENYSNTSLPPSQEDCRGILPPSSREVTPVQEEAPPPVCPTDGEEISFVSGNPFVEVTKGVIHLFKKKYVTTISLCALAYYNHHVSSSASANGPLSSTQGSKRFAWWLCRRI